MGLGSEVAVLDNADFGIGSYDAANVRVHLERASSDRAASISLVCDAKANVGFHRAHRIFSVEKLLEILYGDLPASQINQLLKESLR